MPYDRPDHVIHFAKTRELPFTVALDPVGAAVAAWGGVKLLRDDFGIEPAIVTGPATDNDVGKDIIVQRMGVKAINAVTESMQLGDAVTSGVGLRLSPAAAST